MYYCPLPKRKNYLNSSCSPGISGDIHFDDDETWTINGEKDTTDYTWTALHEIGHALGLRHSNEQSAIMWPWFTGYKPDTKLTQDDINGIQAIYGMVDN